MNEDTAKTELSWEIRDVGKPRLIWIYGGHLTELLPVAVRLEVASLPPRPELDVLLAMLRFLLERVEVVIDPPLRLAELRNALAGQVVTGLTPGSQP
jgi:hypothetical protein